MLDAIQKSQGTSAAIALVKTSVGSDTGEAVNDVLEHCASVNPRSTWWRRITGPDP